MCPDGPLYRIEQVPDSFALLKGLDANQFDHVITDPPYDAHCQGNQMSGTTLEKVALPFDPLESYAFSADLVRVARRWSLVFCAVEGFGEIRRVNTRITKFTRKGEPGIESEYRRGCFWYKPNSMGQLTGDRPAAAYEGIAALHRQGGVRWNGRGSYGVYACDDDAFVCNGTRGEKGRHPNQKPLDLLLKLIDLYTDPDETIFDPFCGSGRVGEAALLMGRKFVGLERDPSWVAAGRARCEAVVGAFGSRIGTLPKRFCQLPKPKGMS